jgi:translation initiation factor eIF-2B subunit delta
MTPELGKRIALLAADRKSGASEILQVALAILREAIAADADLSEVANALRLAHPSMAPLWIATDAALKGDLDHFTKRVARAPQTIARFALSLLQTGIPAEATLRIVTLSYSATVAYILESLSANRHVEVACAEARPALEGQHLARRLISKRIQVTFYSDAAIDHALDTAAAVLVGADAVTERWFLNKSGTRMLAASAGQRGLPVYVAAGREKFVSTSIAGRLVVRSGPAAEVWAKPPTGITVENPYFERIPLELVAAVISDVGVLSSEDVAEMCRDMSHRH